MKVLSPFVYWAQTESAISLKIDLKNASDPSVKLVDNKISFSADGTGAHGANRYEFSLDLYSPVKTVVDLADESMVVRVFDDRISILLQKETAHWWPRLTAQPQKPAWLKINFELWKCEDGDLSEEERRDVMTDYPGTLGRLQQEELGYRKEDMKKVYLVIYNLFQFVGFLYILLVLAVRYMKLGGDSLRDSYRLLGGVAKGLQLLQILEVLHPLVGYTKGGVWSPLLQVSGRGLIVFGMLEGEPRLQSMPVVSYLLLVWSLVEVVRYPYYLCRLYRRPAYPLTWLRYSVWIPLYPLGVLCEAVIVLRNIPFLEENRRLTVSLPNEWNFSFHMPTFLRVYLLFVLLPGLYFLMNHMLRLRNIKLKPKLIIKKVK